METTPDPAGKRARAAGRRSIEELFGEGEAKTASRRVRSSVGRQLFEFVLEQPSGKHAPSSGRILIVDNDQLSRDILSRNLKREGYAVEMETDGPHALTRLAEGIFDLVLWEVALPTLNGLDLLTRIKKDSALQHLPIVLLSEQADTENVIRCIEAGAEDYLSKPFNPALLKARIRGCMERKTLRDQEQRLLATIKTQQERLSRELNEASAYLRSLFPAPVSEPFAIDWRYIPSSELGGDSFGYRWIDDDHFALYLLDVCGHGVGAALLSVAALNVLRSGAMHDVDFRNPEAVLSAVNRAFPMEDHNNRYFTLWYGVYQRSTQKITYGSGGHPPALLVIPGGTGTKKLAAKGMMIGGMPNSRYPAQSCEVPPGSRLFLFCDGAYELYNAEDKLYTYEEFAEVLARLPANIPVDLDGLVAQIRVLNDSKPLDDDLTLITIQF